MAHGDENERGGLNTKSRQAELLDGACAMSWRGVVDWEVARNIAASQANTSFSIAVPMHRNNVLSIIAVALEAIAALPTGKSEDVMEGHEQAYRAVEDLLHLRCSPVSGGK